MAFSTVNLVCDYNHPDGTNADGTVAFELTHAIADTDGNVISPRVPITTTLVSGSSTVSLYATNDATTEPTGVTYKVTETISGAATRVYEVTLTSSPTTQYLADLTPSTTTPSYSYLLDPAGKVDNYVLTVDSSSALGYKWAVSSGGGGGVTSVSGTPPITSTGGATPAIGISAATTLAAGSMSASDKSKLDGIEAGATADQSASELLTAIKTVDGASSGLDADTVDGQHASAFEAAGTAAALVDDLSGVSNASTARTNLGLGGAATLNVGTSAGTVAAGDHNHSGVYEAVGVAAALVDDLSGVSNASTARTNLGLGGLATLSAISSSEITNGTIVNEDVNASAAIALSKLASIATARLLGRTTAGAGAIEELSSADSFVSAASDTTAGKVELATAAETTTGTDTGRAVTPDGLAGSEFGVEVVEIMASDMSTAITTGDGKAGYMVPTKLNGWNLIRAHAGLLVAQSSSGTPTVQIRRVRSGTPADMLSTRITIDANESTSYTAATPSVVDTSNDDVATGDLIYVDVDVSGTGAKGLLVVLEFQLP